MDTISTERSSLLSSANNKTDDASKMSWRDPWFWSSMVTLVLLPTLVVAILFMVDLTDRVYPATPLALHLSVATIGARLVATSSKSSPWVYVVFCALDIFLCGFVYSGIVHGFKNGLIDLDGTIVQSWKPMVSRIFWMQIGMSTVVVLRLLLALAMILDTVAKHPKLEFLYRMAQKAKIIHIMEKVQLWTTSRILERWPNLKDFLARLFLLLLVMASLPLSLCLRSCHQNFFQSPPALHASCCDDLDTTDCFLPFPSFHHMRQDESSRTGWRVTLDNLPPMRNGDQVNLDFLDGLDGFSPMGGPILFYLEGLKASVEAQERGLTPNINPSLPYNLQDSLDPNLSITLLWNVENQQLIPHTARLDYLDPKGPLVLLIPAQPLHHETHYAVAVMNAIDVEGSLLPPTRGMQRLFGENATLPCSRDIDRLKRYQEVLLPTLARASNRTFSSLDSLQLMFDFVTMSDESLEPVRIIRDGTLKQLNEEPKHEVKVTKIHNQNCRWPWTLVARTIDISLQVPWWLEADRRDATLDWNALQEKQSNGWGEAKVSIHVPCSLRAAAVNHTKHKQNTLNAILDYGHGLFYNRNEAYEYALLR